MMRRAVLLLAAALVSLPVASRLAAEASEKACGVRPASRVHRSALLPPSAAPAVEKIETEAPQKRHGMAADELEVQRECQLWIASVPGKFDFAKARRAAPPEPVTVPPVPSR
jgi:hypothetical protein